MLRLDQSRLSIAAFHLILFLNIFVAFQSSAKSEAKENFVNAGLSQAEKDYIRVSIRSYFAPPIGLNKEISVQIQVKLDKSGSFLEKPKAVPQTEDLSASQHALANAAIRAITRAHAKGAFAKLNLETYEYWRLFEIHFSPREVFLVDPAKNDSKPEADSAEALYSAAVAQYQSALNAPQEQKLELMRSVRKTLDEIVERHPSSDLAVQTLLGGKVGAIDMAIVNATLADSAITNVKRSEVTDEKTDGSEADSAEALHNAAVAQYQSALNAPQEQKLELMRSVRKTLDEIVERHPSSDLAVQTLLGGKVGAIDMAIVNATLADSAITNVKRSEVTDEKTDGSETDSAEALHNAAVAQYQSALNAPQEQKLELMRSVRKTLDEIVERHPSSDLAVQTLLGGKVGAIDMAIVNATLADSAITNVKRSEVTDEKTDGSETDSAEALHNAAVAQYQSALNAPQEQKLELMRSVRKTLDEIVERHPSSDFAVQTLLGGKVGAIDMAIVNATLAGPQKKVEDPAFPSDNIASTKDLQDPAYEAISDPELAEEAENDLDLDRRMKRSIQRRLTLIGLNTRGVDGIFGPGTRAAISKWQVQNGWSETGFIDQHQRDVLFTETEAAFKKWQAKAAERARQRRAEERRKNASPKGRAGRYIGSDGCQREADGRRVPHFSLRCDMRGALGLN